jgi:diguanylate cyclase (GGDEF)-like protein/PAS domain S-box-containing protein
VGDHDASFLVAVRAKTGPVMESNPINVLLIEDNPADAEIIQHILAHVKGRSLRLAWSDRLATGLERFHQKPADVILLDLFLPDSQGLNSLTRIRTEAPGAPIVILTGLNDEEFATKAIQRGAQDYLIKGKLTPELLAHSLSHAIERKKGEEALHASEQRYRQLFEDANDAILVADEEGRYIDANRRAEELLGYPREELLQISLADITPPEIAEREATRYEEFKLLGRMSGESVVLRKNGTRVHVEFSSNRFAQGQYLSILRDITERKQAEEALRKSDERFHLVARATNDAVRDWDLTSNTLWWNERFKALFGYKTEEIEPGVESWSDRLHPEDKERVLSGIRAAIDRGERSWTDEYRFLRSDGEYAAIFDRGYVVHNKAGRPVRMIAAMMDITERKRDEAALKENHQLFRAVIEGTTDAIYVKDLQSRYVMINASVARIFGRSAEEIIGKSDLDLFSPETAKQIIEDDRQIVRSGQTQTFEELATIKEITRTYLSTKGPWRNHQGEIVGIIGISWDITERKDTEESVRAYAQQQRALAELGQQALDGLDLSGLLERAAALVAHALETDYCKILEFLPDGKTLLCRTSVEWKEGLLRTDPEAGSESREKTALRENIPAENEDLQTENGSAASTFPSEQDERREINVIIPGASRPFGTLSVYSTAPRRFTEEEIRFLQVVANMLATAIERRRAEEMIQHQAYYDALTGLPNRSLLENHLSLALARADRHNELVALMFLDLDCFKRINDTLGHPVGDQLLKAIAKRLSACVRDGDTFARMGGDEFTVLLPEIDTIARVTLVAERILEAFASPFMLAGHELNVSASIGIALYPHSGRDSETLLKNADAALYRAKEQGRNAFCFFPGDERKDNPSVVA